MTQISSGTLSYPFCADYSAMAACLFAIQNAASAGAFNGNARVLELLGVFEQDVLRKLYIRTIRILETIDGSTTITPGDFDGDDFSDRDFYVGYLDTTNPGFSSRFQTILNIFKEFCGRAGEISEADKAALYAALVPVLDTFDELQQYLSAAGLNPCDSSVVYLNNSPSLYLQAAGSAGTDGIPAGIHLRWSLAGDLGSNHILKGDYDTAATSGYNQSNDYLQVSRTPYNNPVRLVIDFQADKPVIDNAAQTWTYFVTQTIGSQIISNRVRLTFSDAGGYNQLAVNADAAADPFHFLTQYTGLIVFEVLNKTLFMAGFDFGKDAATGNAALKIESESLIGGPEDTAAQVVNSRKTVLLDTGLTSTALIYGENIRKVRVKKSANGYLQRFSFETYHDFLNTRSQADWSPVNSAGFSLSLIDQLVFDRLESPDYPVDNLWPQFNEGTTVRVANYKDKWLTTRPNEPSIKDIVTRYLTLSETDPRAEDILRDEDAGADAPGLLVSYVDVLNILAIDYHIARMLGLGYIDTPAGTALTDKFVYRASYTNRKSLDSAQQVNYSYSSLPTSKLDRLLPEKPVARPLSYTSPAGEPSGSSGFDNQGYLKTDHVRLINIGREPLSDEIPGYNFFADLYAVENYNSFESPKPVLYGIEYRPANQSAYVKPEITSAGQTGLGTAYNAYDPAFPQTGVPETVPIPDNADSLYFHFERQEGVHFYAIYGISWLARASAISNEVATNATVFVPQNRLQPPTDVAVQYIQQEDTLLFTTVTEQAWYQGRSVTFPGLDISLTRIVFNWLDILDISFIQGTTPAELATVPRADKIKAYFDPQLPLEITGLIRDIQPVSGSDTQLRLWTAAYTQIDGRSVSPVINPLDFYRFTDSLLSTPEGQFRVLGLDQGTNGPIITIEKNAQQQNVASSEQPDYYGIQTSYSGPGVSSRFSMVENLSNPANWQAITQDISLTSFADIHNPVIESTTDTEGNISKNWIGGINAPAVISPLFGDSNDQADLPGYYKIEFAAGFVLAPNPQYNLPFDPAHPNQNPPGQTNGAHVEWYKGWLRVPFAAGDTDKKTLEVTRIDQTSPLVLYVYDPSYLDNPITVSATAQTTIPVNFHPGYRAYFFAEPSPAYTFNRDHILPAGNENSRKTLIGLQSADTRTAGSGFSSAVSIPAVLLARKIEIPVQMDAPVASTLKVRPDATAKAALTFDTKVPLEADGTAGNPFGFLFCRTTQEDVLNALYENTTVLQIGNALAALTVDNSYSQRFFELVNLRFDPAHPGQFRVFDASPQPYGFPVPDKSGLVAGGDSDEVKTTKYRGAIEGTILPLTGQTPIAQFIKNGLQTDNKAPVIRDIDGNLLDPAAPAFDPFPMIRKYTPNTAPGTTYIRFTDYTLNAASRNLYFYAATEVTSQLVRGPLSPFMGPVTILQTLPPETPLIRTFAIAASVLPATTPLSVSFQLSPVSPEDLVSLIRIYRTTDLVKAGSLQTMDTHMDIPLEEGLTGGYTLTDTLADLTPFPAGETLYYRLAAVRIIINEFDLPEEVVSLGSETIPVRLIDTINPDAPALTYTQNVNQLTWQPTANKGTYYLYQQNARGNWGRIYSVAPPDSASGMSYTLPAPLVLQDESGNRLYYRFKVQVQNSSGLFNLADKEITI
ncbi:MAG: hypothetical protein JWR38_5264 [Mucilaginibacter sp.]|nr:hypothetical protein [Mucilaginibacter sp.]